MSTPQVPRILDSKATLGSADTETITVAILAASPLPEGKNLSGVRSWTITLIPGPAGAAPTSTVSTNYTS